MTEAAWSTRLWLGVSRSMRAARIACAVAGLGRLHALASDRRRARRECPGLDESPYALFEEERVALRPLDQQSRSGRDSDRTEQRVKQLFGVLGRQRVDASWR